MKIGVDRWENAVDAKKCPTSLFHFSVSTFLLSHREEPIPRDGEDHVTSYLSVSASLVHAIYSVNMPLCYRTLVTKWLQRMLDGTGRYMVRYRMGKAIEMDRRSGRERERDTTNLSIKRLNRCPDRKIHVIKDQRDITAASRIQWEE